MLIHIGYELVFEVPAPVSMQLMLYTHPSRVATLLKPEQLIVEPSIPVHNFIDSFGNHAARIVAPAGKLRLYYDNIAQDSGEHEPKIDGARLHSVDELPDECLQFLLASRYCEVDRMLDMAWDLFGKTPPTWERVQAVMDWVHGHVQFGYEFARPTKTAYDVCTERQGVCRDFMHLAITMLRALNVPARYATGYLGDIGVPPAPFPMDFSAWFEVYLGNRWYAMDARHNEPRIGRVLQARGRDAVDVALTTSFGSTRLEKFTVWTDEVNG
ncbi:MAG TPA: transglutaminase family protein [Tepidisphaeraceae bacterium]|jgi:transglutaminase-like putative cysteine protease